MIAEAERPIVIGGRGATWSGAKGALEALAEESGAVLATTLLGKGLFDGNPFALDIAGTFATDLGREYFAEPGRVSQPSGTAANASHRLSGAAGCRLVGNRRGPIESWRTLSGDRRNCTAAAAFPATRRRSPIGSAPGGTSH